MSELLKGIRVIDLTQAYSGPFCTMHLADHGAEVIKIEAVNGGDQSRTWGPFKNNYSAYYAYINRNKKGMALNLKEESGKAVLWDLIKEADVICENFKVGTLEKWGFTYEKMKAVNPGIIYGSISGYGITGVDDIEKRPAYDIVAQAMSGIMSVTGHPQSPCVKIGPSIGDNYSGTYLALAICMALYNRERTGKGSRLDIAMLDTLFSVMENFVVTYTVTGEIPQRMGNIDPGIAPFDSFETNDGELVLGCGTTRMWKGLCEAMGREELIEDPRFLTNEDRCKNYLPELKEIVTSWTRTKTAAELEAVLVEKGIPVATINNIKQVCEHPQISHRRMLWELKDSGIGETIRVPGTPIKVQGSEDAPTKAAPLLGEDTRSVLEDLLGYTPQKVSALEQDGVIVTV